MIYETNDWDGMDGQTVTVVDRADVCGLLGVKRVELRGRLRQLRDQGRLVHDPNRLTKRRRVRDESAKYGVRHVRCYVLRGRAGDIERTRRRVPVILWR